jgi:hypothetical protein
LYNSYLHNFMPQAEHGAEAVGEMRADHGKHSTN